VLEKFNLGFQPSVIRSQSCVGSVSNKYTEAVASCIRSGSRKRRLGTTVPPFIAPTQEKQGWKFRLRNLSTQTEKTEQRRYADDRSFPGRSPLHPWECRSAAWLERPAELRDRFCR
jgi:hypothetical protein